MKTVLRSVFLKTLRDQRTSALAWGAGFGLIVIVVAAAWARAYPDQASRALIAAQVQSALSIAQVLYGQPHHIELFPGWIEWRSVGIFRLLLGIVAVLTATGVTRGAEELGTIECAVSAVSRGRVFLEQAASVFAGTAVTCVLIWFGMLAAGPVAGETAVSVADSFMLTVDLYLAAVLSAGLGLLAGHFTTSRRSAAIAAGGAVMAMHVWDNLAAITPSLEPLRPASPFYLYSASAPLSEGRVDVLAFVGLASLSAASVALAYWLVKRRDLNAAVRPPWSAAYRPLSPAPTTAAGLRQALGLRLPFLRGLDDSRLSILAWGAGLALFCALLAAVTPGIRQVWAESAAGSALSRLLNAQTITDAAVLSFGVFGFLPLLLSLFGLTLAASWAAEETGRRLELELACPVPRAAYFLQRLGAAIAATVIVSILAGAGLFISAAAAGIDLDWGAAVVALVLLTPLTATVVAFGYFVSSLRPRLVAAVGATALLVSYFLEILVPLFDWPKALSDLSVFHLYGRPLLDGPDWPSTLALATAAAFLAIAGSVAFSGRDISR